MKKLVLLFISIVIIIGALWLIPTQKQYTHKIIIDCTPTAATRIISNFNHWKQWWPGEIKNDSVVSYKKSSVKLQTILLNGFYAAFNHPNIPSFIDLQFLSAPDKHSEFIYSYTLYYSPNPFKKAIQFLFQSREVKQELDSFLKDIKSNLENVNKVYGFEITEERVPNSIHISVKKEFNHLPNNDDIYSLVEALQGYIESNQAKAINDPIYNVFTTDDIHYQLMVAIATDRPLPSKGDFSYKEMVRGKIIIGKAIGPNAAIDECMKQVEYFVKDHGRSSPAIQFNRMISDRRKESDSTKWITAVNYPVFDRSFF